jgi:hypothetical protein
MQNRYQAKTITHYGAELFVVIDTDNAVVQESCRTLKSAMEHAATLNQLVDEDAAKEQRKGRAN